MNQTALRSDFQTLPPSARDAHLRVLHLLEQLRLSCRCEMAGRDFTIVVGRGLSSAKYWIDLYTNPQT